jgi:CubicO group peptidase (beta-lactamase class C family)
MATNKTITFAQILNHTSGLRNDNAGGDYLYANMQTLMEHSIAMADKVNSYANVNTALARVLVASLDGYTDWVANGDGSAARFITYVNNKILAPLGIYDVAYKATGAAPTLFYPNPTGDAHGTSYGDWTLKPGSAGGHNSIHELAVFATATFGGKLLSNTKITELKTNSLGFGDYGTYADGTKCYGKGGYFPGSWNGGAELNTVLISCDNGINAMVMINGEMSAKTVFQNAMNAAFTPQ